MLSVRLWLGKRLFGEIGSGFLPAGTRVSPKRWIKWSKAPEVEALEFVAANTKISVPKVYKTFTRDGYLLVEMEYVKGEPITKNWRNLTLDQKRSLMEELGGYLRQLKDLKPPEGCLISSTQGGPCSNVRIGRRLFGPFKTVDAFHECLRGGTALDDPAFNENMELVHSRPYEIRYTHSDISISNILVHDGKIAAIID